LDPEVDAEKMRLATSKKNEITNNAYLTDLEHKKPKPLSNKNVCQQKVQMKGGLRRDEDSVRCPIILSCGGPFPQEDRKTVVINIMR
jgi:hypothetical protein